MTSFDGFRSLIENGSDAISLINARGEILYASASASTVLGYEPQELVGKNSLDLIYCEDRGDVSRRLSKLSTDPGPHQWHVRIRRKDGTLSWVESTACNMLGDPDVQAISVNHRDISAKKEAEDRRRREGEERARSALLLEELTRTVAKDLRQLLGTISLLTETLAGDSETNEKGRAMLRFSVGAAARLSGLLNDLLLPAGTGVTVNLEEVAARAIEDLAEELSGSHATITFGPLPLVRGDAVSFAHVFRNLIGNALKFRGADPPEVHISASLGGPECVIRIIDNGIGVAPENHQSIFGLFMEMEGEPGRTKGLSSCRRLLEAMGGRIWVESEPGAGATFCFTIVEAATSANSLPASELFSKIASA